MRGGAAAARDPGARTMTARLLCVGDIHLGRRPSRLPAWVLERVGAAALSPAAAWAAAVEEALRLEVDALLLAGDVVEQSDDYYEAYGDLRAGVEKLAAAGVRVLGVAGNHDVEVLPRLAAAIEGFHLLGAGGTWERTTLRARDGSELRLLGWSFPSAEVRSSPLARGLPPREGAAPVIGLLHCDRDQSGSRYAPVRTAELEAAPVDAWLLGHIHRPDALAGPRPVGYLGSLLGLDPGEPGAHGPWLLEVAGDGRLAMRQRPLAPLRWEQLEVPIGDLGEPGEVHGRITAAVEALHETVAEPAQRPRAVGCRIALTGRTAHRLALERRLAEEDPRALRLTREGIEYFVERVALRVQPAVDLEVLAQARDPAGLLAQRLLLLRGDARDPQRQALIEAAGRRLARAAAEPVWNELHPAPPDARRTAALLEEAALHALEALLEQRGEET